jgi:hypothetical protein
MADLLDLTNANENLNEVLDEDVRSMLTTKSIKLIHAAHAKATQAIEQHIAPGYEAGFPLFSCSA